MNLRMFTNISRSKPYWTTRAWVTMLIATSFAAGAARAEKESQSEAPPDRGSAISLAATIGGTAYFMDHDVHRGPMSLELVPSIGRSWFKLDLGCYVALESRRIAGTNVGNWNFTFRPGGRLAPPMIPLYLRAAIPLQMYRDHFDWGVMFGVGADFRVLANLGIVFEVDTTLSNKLKWGGDGVPVEFRGGLSFHF